MTSPLFDILESYKVHHKDLDVCFYDAVAVHHIEHAILALLNEAIGPDEKTKNPSGKSLLIDIRNDFRAEIRAKLGIPKGPDVQ